MFSSIRSSVPRNRQSFEYELSAALVENVHFFINPTFTFNSRYYKNYKYTPDSELILMSYSLDHTKLKEIQTKTMCQPNCVYSNGPNCPLCIDTQYNLNKKCVPVCPDNTFADTKRYCQPCDTTCSTCSGPNNGNCLTCVSPLYYNQGKCDIRCPDNLYGDNLKQCQPCGKNCMVCKDLTNCGTCSTDNFLKDGKCEPSCGEKYYKSLQPNQCKPCPNNCNTCDSADKCTSCADGFFLKGITCVSNCGPEFFGDKNTKLCKPCSQYCSDCQDPTICNKCILGFNLLNTICKPDCPTQTVSVNGVCVKCTDPNCDVCSSLNVAECKQCNITSFKKLGKCVPTCGDGYYPDVNRECQPCFKNCNSCSKDKCFQCLSNQYVLRDTECVTDCPPGYIVSGNQCVKCNQPTICNKCMNNNLDTCTKCYDNKLLYNGKCLYPCPDGTYAVNGECQNCIKGCSVCQNLFNCVVCSANFFMQNFICVDKCDKGFAAIGNNTCKVCTVGQCEDCSTSIDNCKKCSGTKYLYNNQCIDKCPLGTFPLPTMTCDSCSVNCIDCSNKYTCNRCAPGKVLQGTNCVSVCDDGYVAINSICTKCNNLNCKNCVGTNLNQCYGCPIEKFLFNGDCVPRCPEKTFPNNGKCLDCQKPCNRCTNLDICIDCLTGFSLQGTKCTDNCNDKFVSMNQVCLPCKDTSCLKCTDVTENKCIKCDVGFSLMGSICVQPCPVGYFSLDGVCKPCLQNCKICKDATSCDLCIDKMFLKDKNQCVSDCTPNFVGVSTECKKCNPACKTCDSKDTNSCITCPANYYLYLTDCRANCPENTYPTDKMTCHPCPMNNCRTCQGGLTCTDCISNYVLQDNKCIPPPCSDGWILADKSNICKKCEVNNCKSCPNTNLKSCDNCIANYYLINDNRCEKECIASTFINPVTRKCQPCSTNCLSCTNDKICTVCENNYYLFENSCRPDCPTGYSKTNGKCLPCAVANCSTCPNNKDCDKCLAPNVLQDNLCKPICDLTYFSNNGICKKCSLYCNQCIDENNCTMCQAGKVLSADNKCIDSCPSGSVPKNNQCTLCKGVKDCDKCDDNLTNCKQCTGTLVLKSNTCVENCGDNFYTQTRICYPCKEYCKKCNDDKTCLECTSGYSLYKDSCVLNCPNGFRKENGKCVVCPVSCDKCDTEKCLICTPPTLLQDGKCVPGCSTRYYEFNPAQCNPCGNACLNCLTDKSCNICDQGYYLKDGLCVTDCGIGYVASNGKCHKCDVNCNLCNRLNPAECLECATGKPLFNLKCLDNCLPGYYVENNKCLPCLTNCGSCDDNKTCNKCSPSFYLSPDKKVCDKTCPDGYKPSKGACEKCDDKNCQKCNTSTIRCDNCNSPMLNYNGVCVAKCPDGNYNIPNTNNCDKCDATCLKCLQSPTNCQECVKGYVLQNQTCVNNCLVGWVSVNSVCKKCETIDCDDCNIDLKTCIKCSQGRVLFTENNVTKCKDTCPSQYYNNQAICNPCISNCEICASNTNCNKCLNNFVIQSGKCQDRCNKFYVERNGQCFKCNDPNCVTCDQLTLDTCKRCDENYVLKNNQCIADCGSGFFKFAIEEKNNVCQPCSSKCESCTSATKCDKCMTGAYLKNNECVVDCGPGWVIKSNTKCVQCTSPTCLTCDSNNPDKCIICNSQTYLKDGICVNSCGDKYYGSNKSTCIPCTDTACVKCSPESKCLICGPSKFLLNGECKDSCPTGWIPDNSSVCIQCTDPQCHTCLLSDINKCKTCKTSYLLQPDLLCKDTCPTGYYNNNNQGCNPCPANCKTCTSDTNCPTCNGTLVLVGTMCNDKCPDGQVEINKKCEKCKPNNCSICQNIDKCDVCLKTFFLYQGKCVTACPAKTYLSGIRCVDCDITCKECISDIECKTCEATYLYFNKKCLTACPIGYYALNGECLQCPNFEMVISCDKEQPQCKKEYFLFNNKCVKICPDKTYADSANVCQPCGTDCLKCVSPSNCLTCQTMKLYNNQCVTTCPDKTVELMGKCVDCTNPNCKNCMASNTNKCPVCVDKLFFLDNDCLTVCPVGYYPEGYNCKKCDTKCSDCKSDTKCIKCLTQYILYEDQCVSTCPPSYVQRIDRCYACASKKCDICDANDLNNCLSCNGGFLYNGLCIITCPVTTRADPVTKKCLPCTNYCDNCTATGCTTCSNGYYFSEANPTFCIDCTSPDYVIMGTRCEKCKVLYCKKCTTAKTDECSVCDSTKFLVNGKCLDNCPSATYPSGQSCLPCSTGCNSCADIKNCNLCTKPNIVMAGICSPKCNPGFVPNPDGTKCIQCPQQECSDCNVTNTASCNTCFIPNFLYKNKCFKLCPKGTYPDGSNCIDCPNGCLSCSSDQCDGCNNGLKLKGNDCVDKCGKGYFDAGAKCDKCLVSNCEACSPANNCTKCDDTSYLLSSTLTCVLTCPKGFYESPTTRTCIKCDEGCVSCNDTKKCVECEKGLVLNNGLCVKNCPDGYSPFASVCAPCSVTDCKTCSAKQDECDNCKTTLLYNKKCFPVCPRTTYADSTLTKCIDCNSRCDVCKDQFTCITCKSEFNLFDGRCVDKCSNGKVDINGICIPCADQNCKTCLRDTNICIECNDPFALNDNSCRTDCPTTKYKDLSKTCKDCDIGCAICNDNKTCKTCSNGFYLYNGKCVRDCPKSMYGDCKDTKNNICYNCNEACEDCSDGTNSNCSKCAKDFYMNDLMCVRASDCKKGTYPNNETRKCIACRIQFCAQCDVDKCVKCTEGFELNTNGDCVLSKTFVSVISQYPRLFSSKTSKLFRDTEIKNFYTDLKGTGVETDYVSFSFWLRRTTNTVLPTKIFQTQSKGVAMNTFFEIKIKDGKEICYLSVIFDTNINILDLGNCSYNALVSWKFYAVTLFRNGNSSSATVRITDSTGNDSMMYVNFVMQNSIYFVNKNSTLVFNPNYDSDTIATSSAFELANFNVFDYPAFTDDIKKFSLTKPFDCDYSCTDCGVTCNKCSGNLNPFEGYCPASFVSVRRDYHLIYSPDLVDLRNKITRRLDSNRYSFFLWFNSDNQFKLPIDIANVFYDYPQPENLISFSVANNTLIVRAGNEEFSPFNKNINKGQWYLIGASIIGQSLKVYLNDWSSTIVNKKDINLNNVPHRINEDIIFTTGNPSNVQREIFNGSYYDMRLYTNNIPDDDQIIDHFRRLPCPDNCDVCTSTLVCSVCKNGFVTKDNKCVDAKLGRALVLLDKYSFLQNNTLTLSIPETFVNNTYIISFFYRKKLHTPTSPTYNLLRISNAIDSNIPLIQETTGSGYKSTFTLLGGQNPQTTSFVHDFSDEIYKFIHFVVQINLPTKTISYSINDGKEYSFTRTSFDKNINKLILGDSLSNSMNFEIAYVNIYPGVFSTSDIATLRQNIPNDCNPGCLNCDYTTGICKMCASSNDTTVLACGNVLSGWKNSEAFEMSKNDTFINEYDNSIRSLFSKDVNSDEYSVFGYFKLFDKKIINANKNGRFQVFRVSNKHNETYLRSSYLLGLDIVNVNGNATYHIIYADGDTFKSVPETRIDVVEESWLLILATVNVNAKTIQYAIQSVNSAIFVTNTIKLAFYPEKLIESASLGLLGFSLKNDFVTKNYNILNAYFYNFYLGVNLKFDIGLMDKIKKLFPVPQPTCPQNCDKCFLNNNNVIECLSCKVGYELQNYKCYLQDSKFVALVDQNRYTYLPPSTDLPIPAELSLEPKNTITFYFRRNYSPKVANVDNTIFRGGNVYLKLNSIAKGSASLNFGVDSQVSTLPFTIDEDLLQDYKWYFIIIQFSSDTINIIVKDDKISNTKGLTMNNNTKIAITSISFNSLVDQISIYAPSVILRDYYDPPFVAPSTFCELECDMCLENKCVECSWGFDKKNNRCNTQPITINPFMVGAGSKFSNSYPLRKYLNNPKPLRSATWSILIQMQLFGSFESYAQTPLFSINGGSDQSNLNNLFSLSFNSNNSFFLTVLNRFLSTNSGGSAGFSTQSFKFSPTNDVYVIGISFNDNTNEIKFSAYNSEDNYITQTIAFKGRSENLNLDATLNFASSSSNSTVMFDNIQFYFDSALTDEMVNNFISQKQFVYQKACAINTLTYCKSCKSGVNVGGNKFCSIRNDTVDLWRNQIKNVTPNSNSTYALTSNIDFPLNSNSFTFSFWYKILSYTTEPFGIISLNSNPESKASVQIKTENNIVWVELYDKANNLVNEMVYENLITPNEGLTWIYFSVSVDIPTNTLQLYVYNSKSKSNRILSNKGKTGVNLGVTPGKQVSLNAGYVTALKNTGYSFQVSSFLFTPNWFAKDSIELEQYRLKEPPKCSNKCTKACDNNNLCPLEAYISTDINVGDAFADDDLKDKFDADSLKKSSMFRTLDDFVVDNLGTLVWTEALISFDIDTNQYLTSKYTTNKNILININNNPKSALKSLTMNDVVPSESLQYAVLGLELVNNGCKFYLGSSAVANTINNYNINFPSLAAFSKINVNVFLDTKNSIAKITVYIDDLRTFYDITPSYPLETLNLKTLIYSHPSISNVRFNVQNPRYVYELNNYYIGKSQDLTTYPSNVCGSDCVKCSYEIPSQTMLCTRCPKNYKLVNNQCLKSYS